MGPISMICSMPKYVSGNAGIHGVGQFEVVFLGSLDHRRGVYAGSGAKCVVPDHWIIFRNFNPVALEIAWQ